MIKKALRQITTLEQRIYIYETFEKSKRFVETTKDKLLTKPITFEEQMKAFEYPYRLHLGCGNIKLAGFCNVDVLDTVANDVQDDIRKLEKFPNNSAKEIYACHVLEHFAHHEIEPILRRWLEILAPGGVLRISVPDIDRIVKIYHKNFKHFETPGNSPWVGLIYGGQSTPYDYHKTGFNACWLKHLLENYGYVNCEEYPHFPHFVEGADDASLAKEPFGEYFSLNMMATKPS